MEQNTEVVMPDQGARPMPAYVQAGLIKVQGGQQYLKAAYRVLWMRDEHPDWQIETKIAYADWEKKFVVFQATIRDGEGNLIAQSHSEENVGKLPYVKKAETGALARALGLAGYGTIFGDLDEDSDGVNMADAPQNRGGAPKPANGQTPTPKPTPTSPQVSVSVPTTTAAKPDDSKEPMTAAMKERIVKKAKDASYPLPPEFDKFTVAQAKALYETLKKVEG